MDDEADVSSEEDWHAEVVNAARKRRDETRQRRKENEADYDYEYENFEFTKPKIPLKEYKRLYTTA
jgi:hypothetical protein